MRSFRYSSWWNFASLGCGRRTLIDILGRLFADENVYSPAYALPRSKNPGGSVIRYRNLNMCSDGEVSGGGNWTLRTTGEQRRAPLWLGLKAGGNRVQ
jgi:hypothetical protein